MAGIPSLVGFDFTYGMGSQTPAMARLLAETGQNLAKSIETFATKNEATARAPIMQQAYAAGYAKIAEGDFSGFTDLTAASSMAAGNPLLMQMAKEANDLGTHLATNYTSQSIARERIAAEAARGTQAEDRMDARFKHQEDMQEDAQAQREREAAIRTNAQIKERNAKRISASKLTGDAPQLEQEVPVPEPRQARSMGADTGRLDVSGDLLPGLPSKSDPDNALAQQATADRLAAESSAQPATAQSSTAPTAASTAATGQPAGPAEKVSSTRKEEEPVALKLGDLNITVKRPEGKMKKTGVDVDSETGSVKTHMKVDSEKEKDYGDFVEGISTMQGLNPDAAGFVAQYIRGGLVFKNERSEGKVRTFEMYGKGKDGKLVPYNAAPLTEEQKKKGEQPVAETVTGDFYEAHKQAIAAYPKIKDLVDIQEPAKADMPDPMDKLKDYPELAAISAQLKKDVAAGRIKPDQAKARYKAAEKNFEEEKTYREEGGDVKALKKEELDRERKRVAPKINEIKRQIADIEQQLSRGKSSIDSSGGEPGVRIKADVELTERDKKELILRKARLKDKLKELDI